MLKLVETGQRVGHPPQLGVRLDVLDPLAFEPHLAPIAEIVEAIWPGVPILPRMSTGATDGLYVRNAGIPVYGVSAIFDDPDDVRAHGRDERVPVKSFYEANEFWYRMLQALSR